LDQPCVNYFKQLALVFVPQNLVEKKQQHAKVSGSRNGALLCSMSGKGPYMDFCSSLWVKEGFNRVPQKPEAGARINDEHTV